MAEKQAAAPRSTPQPAAADAALRKALQWALTVIEEWANGKPDSNGTPAHDCDFVSNPEKGSCDFHDEFWNATLLAARTPSTPEES
jgi:hypothetical protein